MWVWVHLCTDSGNAVVCFWWLQICFFTFQLSCVLLKACFTWSMLTLIIVELPLVVNADKHSFLELYMLLCIFNFCYGKMPHVTWLCTSIVCFLYFHAVFVLCMLLLQAVLCGSSEWFATCVNHSTCAGTWRRGSESSAQSETQQSCEFLWFFYRRCITVVLHCFQCLFFHSRFFCSMFANLLPASAVNWQNGSSHCRIMFQQHWTFTLVMCISPFCSSSPFSDVIF